MVANKVWCAFELGSPTREPAGPPRSTSVPNAMTALTRPISPPTSPTNAAASPESGTEPMLTSGAGGQGGQGGQSVARPSVPPKPELPKKTVTLPPSHPQDVGQVSPKGAAKCSPGLKKAPVLSAAPKPPVKSSVLNKAKSEESADSGDADGDGDGDVDGDGDEEESHTFDVSKLKPERPPAKSAFKQNDAKPDSLELDDDQASSGGVCLSSSSTSSFLFLPLP